MTAAGANPVCLLALPQPHSAEEEQALVSRFVEDVRRLFEGADADLRERLLRAMRHPVDCPRCAAVCHVFQGSGRDPEYRPGIRGGVLRRIYHKYVTGGGRFATWWHGDVELDWARISRLAQLAYSCNQCEKCAQSCHSADHALVARQLRSIFRGMGIAPAEQRFFDPASLRERVREIDEQTTRRSGVEVRTPWDLEGAEVLVVEPASSITDWPENFGALALLLTCAGIRWTLSSQLASEDQREVFERDPVQLQETARRYVSVARRLKAKKIVAGESGAAYEALCVDHGAGTGELAVGRESVVTLLRDIVRSGRLEFDPIRNDFPVTLHDPCRLVRHGVVGPQREVLRQLCPQFREMDPWAEKNICCGGGAGLARIASAHEWRVEVSGSKKMKQVLEAFSECLAPDTPKYVCAPCGDCSAQLRELVAQHAPWETHRIRCGGLAELVVNAMTAVRPGFLNWENH